MLFDGIEMLNSSDIQGLYDEIIENPGNWKDISLMNVCLNGSYEALVIHSYANAPACPSGWWTQAYQIYDNHLAVCLNQGCYYADKPTCGTRTCTGWAYDGHTYARCAVVNNRTGVWYYVYRCTYMTR